MLRTTSPTLSASLKAGITTAILSRKRSGSFASRNSSQARPSSRAESCWFIRADLGQRPQDQQEEDRDGEHRETENSAAVAALEGEGGEQGVEQLGPRDDREPDSAEDGEQDCRIGERAPAPDREGDQQDRENESTGAQRGELFGEDGGDHRDGQGGGQNSHACGALDRARRCAAPGVTLPRSCASSFSGATAISAGRRRCASPPAATRSPSSTTSRAARWHERHGTDSLTPIRSLEERIDAWQEVSGNEIRSYVGAIEDAGVPRGGGDRDEARGGRSTTASSPRRPTRWRAASRRSRPSTRT